MRHKHFKTWQYQPSSVQCTLELKFYVQWYKITISLTFTVITIPVPKIILVQKPVQYWQSPKPFETYT